MKGAISSVSDDPGSIASKKYTLCLPPESSPAEHQYCILLVAAVDQYFPDCSSTHESTCTSSSRCTWDASTKTCSSSASGTDLLLGAVVASWIIIVLSLGYGLYYLKNNYSRVKAILSGKPTPGAAAESKGKGKYDIGDGDNNGGEGLGRDDGGDDGDGGGFLGSDGDGGDGGGFLGSDGDGDY